LIFWLPKFHHRGGEKDSPFNEVKMKIKEAKVTTDYRNSAVNEVLVRDRIKDLRRIRAKDLLPNPKNWRRHPKAQAEALQGLLSDIGYADALIVRELPDARLMIIDGHLRAETTPDAMVPVLVLDLDVTEDEADKLLLALDPLAAMAESDAERITDLLRIVKTDNDAVQELFRRTAGNRIWDIVHPPHLEQADVSTDLADKLMEKWGSEVGQLWRIGPHRIICGDCADTTIVDHLFEEVDSARFRMVTTHRMAFPMPRRTNF
jgi:hypothetical protein